ncbi:sugar phosphate isomerase/epimerase family protein [Parapedobacter koreensis]|uniref:Sugar phosphate isomerase/epimerase n=1 Tax=Parapedobacter koreensis TaxID=332977 RepID=A0A1H7FYY6_9SPHI|nr:sugar phosphate isomerase/epimerase [Parapedobacter koreensis]SEK29390.1 Sugar phosphate isomerase/epimerase [Parapedobacter koreensis]
MQKVAVGALLLPSLAKAGISEGLSLAKIKQVGLQLYSVRGEMLADPIGTLKQLAAFGFTDIESAAEPGKGAFYGLAPKEIKQICQDLGMTVRSGHVSLDDQWQQSMEDAVEAGQEYLICRSLPNEGKTADNYKRAAELFNKAGEACKKHRLIFGYHNHSVEFQQENGQVLYDLLLEHTDSDLVTMELDLGWMVATGNDPLDYFRRYKGRFGLWHLKDMDGRRSVELGKGDLDIVNLIKNGKQAGMNHLFIEQEQFAGSTPMESMERNVKYVKGLTF